MCTGEQLIVRLCLQASFIMYATKRYANKSRSGTVVRRTTSTKRVAPRYPRYRSPNAYNTPFQICRSVDQDVYLDLAAGWNQRGPGLSTVWSLDNVILTFTDGFSITKAIPGASELSALFDQWRIDKVEQTLLFSATQNPIATGGIITSANVQPVINIVNDWDNNDPNDDLLQYPQCRTIQLGTSPQGNLQRIIKPGAIGTIEIAGSTTVPGQVLRGPWLDTATPTITHHCIKISYAQFSTAGPDFNPPNTIGALKIRNKVYYTLKNPR